MKLLTYLVGRGFTGGPDFRLTETKRADLQDIRLEFTAPTTNIVFADSPRPINFPFKSPGWFDRNCKQHWNHFLVSVDAEMWAYLGPYWKVMNEPFGTLSMGIWLKRALPGKTLGLNDLDSLADAIRWDYEEYFEAKEPGQYGRGKNWAARNEANERYDHWQDQVGREQKAAFLRNRLRQLPDNFEVRNYADQRWLYYRLEREPNYPMHHYCQPLDERYYLDVHFHYGIDFRDYFHIWKEDAEAAEQRIMQTVKLIFPNRLKAPA